MKLNLLIFSSSALCLLAACSSGIASEPVPDPKATQTAVAGTQTGTAPDESFVTPSPSGQGTAGQATTQPTQGLPQTPPDAQGIFDHRQDSSIFIDTSIVAQQDQPSTNTQGGDGTGGSSFQSSSDPNAPEVEVVVTAQTIIYKDVTVREPLNGPPPADYQAIKQVELGSLDEIGQLCLITVWGSRTGDRVVADVLIYSFPNMQSQ